MTLRNKNRQIKLVRALNNAQIKQAIHNYCNGVSLARLIAGECLNADAINEFRKSYIKPRHTAQRVRCNIQAKMEQLAAQQPIKIEYSQLFEDDNRIKPARTRISAITQHNNLYGCAAGMCSEK